MADLSVTAASVLAATDAVTETRPAGEAVTAGQWLYLESATDTYKKADSDSATAAVRSPRGMALNGGGIGQPIQIIRSGSVTSGATMTAGLAYYLSKTAGGMCPVADIASGGYATVLGIATSTTVLKINITESGVAV